MICKVLASPLFSVKFRHFYVADCLQSFIFSYRVIVVYLWGDVDWKVLCIISILPGHFRLLQCLRRYNDSGKSFPHVYNAMKYLLGMVFTLSCIYHGSYGGRYSLYLKFILGIFSSLYSLYWDMAIDWGDSEKEENI